MKKLGALLLSAALCCMTAVPALAAEGNNTQMPVTYSVQADYVVVIPKSAEITFNTEKNPIGAIEYQEGNLEPGAEITVTLANSTPLAHTEDAQYTIDYKICNNDAEFTSVVYDEDTAAGTETALTADITKASWEAAKAGNYRATLTFAISYANK